MRRNNIKGLAILFAVTMIGSIGGRVLADGVTIAPSPVGDAEMVGERGQQAFINYENGTEKLFIGVDTGNIGAGSAWIVPIPGSPEIIKVDVASEWPVFAGDEVFSKLKINLDQGLGALVGIGAAGQLWPLPFLGIRGISSMSMGAVDNSSVSGGDVVVASHLEKNGLTIEVITAKDSQAIDNYLVQKGFNLNGRNLLHLNDYINKDYSFVVAWVGVPQDSAVRGIIVNFPTAKLYYPMMLTSAYGDAIIPITVRVLGHVTPEIPAVIKNYAKTTYYTKTNNYEFNAVDSSSGPDMAISPELKNFYGVKKPWIGNEDYTKIEINAPSKLFTGDIWIIDQRPLKIFIVTWLSSHVPEAMLGIYLLVSMLAGAAAGFICYRRPAKCAVIGLGNICTIIGVAVLFKIMKGKERENRKTLKFYVIFSLIFVVLLILAAVGLSYWSMPENFPSINQTVQDISVSGILGFIFLFVLPIYYLLVSAFTGAIAGWICFRKPAKYALIGLGNIMPVLGLMFLFEAKIGPERENKKSVTFIGLYYTIFIVLFFGLAACIAFSFTKLQPILSKSSASCADAGLYAYSDFWKKNIQCCAGLDKVVTEYSRDEQKCARIAPLDFACIKCGDGDCGAYEDECNCPRDCPCTGKGGQPTYKQPCCIGLRAASFGESSGSCYETPPCVKDGETMEIGGGDLGFECCDGLKQIMVWNAQNNALSMCIKSGGQREGMACDFDEDCINGLKCKSFFASGILNETCINPGHQAEGDPCNDDIDCAPGLKCAPGKDDITNTTCQ